MEKLVMQNQQGMKVELITYGTILVSIEVPDRTGTPGDVVAGFDTIEGYLQGHPYFGCLVGRFANRIAGGVFELDGNTYSLARNNDGNHLHGGVEGFDKKVWSIMEVHDGPDPSVRLRYLSQHLEEGYPGNLEVLQRVTLGRDNSLHIDLEARTDRPTILNLTNHSYFNLSAFRENIYRHELRLFSRSYTDVGPGLIPTGKLLPVEGTPLDFQVAKPVGRDIDRIPPGYDHNFVVEKAADELGTVAELYDPKSGRLMTVRSTQPAVQLYTGNFLDGSLRGKSGIVYGKHAALCLETQHYPDSIHHPHFPSVVLREGEIFSQRTVFSFSVRPQENTGI